VVNASFTSRAIGSGALGASCIDVDGLSESETSSWGRSSGSVNAGRGGMPNGG